MNQLLKIGVMACLAVAFPSSSSMATLITYDVNLHFDPNSTPSFTLGPNGPGTVTGTITIDTSIPIFNYNLGTQIPGYQASNLVSANLSEQSNNGTVLNGFTNSASEIYNNVTPYAIIFFGSPVLEYPVVATLGTENQVLYERLTFTSPPVIDSIQSGPSIAFDFPFTAGGNVVPGNFDSQASTGFNAYLFGAVTPSNNSVPEPSSMALLGLGAIIVAARGIRRHWLGSR